MSICVNLVPIRRLQARQRRRRVRQWLGACTVYLALLAVACGVVDAMWGRPGRAVTEELAAVHRDAADVAQQLALVQPELAEAKNHLEASRAVAVQPDWSILLALLSRLRGESIVLERCALTPDNDPSQIRPAQVTPVAAPAANLRPPLRKHMSVRFELRGLGRTNQDVSAFVLKLEQAGLFDSVRLLETARAPFGPGHAVSFRVHCLLQEKQEGTR